MLTSFGNLSVWEENSGMSCSLLFLHGHCTNKSFFNKQMDADIFKSYHRIAIDFPGLAEAITEVIHQLPINLLQVLIDDLVMATC